MHGHRVGQPRRPRSRQSGDARCNRYSDHEWQKTLWKIVRNPTVEVVAAIVVVLLATWIVVQTETDLRQHAVSRSRSGTSSRCARCALVLGAAGRRRLRLPLREAGRADLPPHARRVVGLRRASRYAFDEHWIPVGPAATRSCTPGGSPGRARRCAGDALPARRALEPHRQRHAHRPLARSSASRCSRSTTAASARAPTSRRPRSLAYEDAEAAWDYLAKLAPGRPRYIVGHSLGGAIAAELARRRPDAAGLVLEATFTSVRDMVDAVAVGLPAGGPHPHAEASTRSPRSAR